MKKEDLIALGVPEDIAGKIAEAIAKAMEGHVPKAKLDEAEAAKTRAEDAVKERDSQLERLKKSVKDADGLREQIASLQAENKAKDEAHAAELHTIRVDNAVTAALTAAGARNHKAARALLDLEKAELDADGSVKGLAAQIEALAKAEDSKFLFGAKSAARGAKIGEDGLDGPEGRVDFSKMSYDQLAAYLEANPGAKLE